MKDVNRMRLQRMAERYERDRAARGEGGESEAEKAAAYARAFESARSTVLLPLIEEIGAELRSSGHDYRVETNAPGESPKLDWYLVIRGRSGSKDLIQFFVKRDDDRACWEVIAEIVLKRSPVELKRFREPDQIKRDVAEQLFVDAIEHLFASPPK